MIASAAPKAVIVPAYRPPTLDESPCNNADHPIVNRSPARPDNAALSRGSGRCFASSPNVSRKSQTLVGLVAGVDVDPVGGGGTGG